LHFLVEPIRAGSVVVESRQEAPSGIIHATSWWNEIVPPDPAGDEKEDDRPQNSRQTNVDVQASGGIRPTGSLSEKGYIMSVITTQDAPTPSTRIVTKATKIMPDSPVASIGSANRKC
jgi:hypothetical protein